MPSKTTKTMAINFENFQVYLDEIANNLTSATDLTALANVLEKSKQLVLFVDNYSTKNVEPLVANILTNQVNQVSDVSKKATEEVFNTFGNISSQIGTIKKKDKSSGSNKITTVSTMLTYIKKMSNEAGSKEIALQDTLSNLKTVLKLLEGHGNFVKKISDNVKSKGTLNNIGRLCSNNSSVETPLLDLVCGKPWVLDDSHGSVCHPIIFENSNTRAVVTHMTIAVSLKSGMFTLVQNLTNVIACEKKKKKKNIDNDTVIGEQCVELVKETCEMMYKISRKGNEIEHEPLQEKSLEKYLANTTAESVLNIDQISDDVMKFADFLVTLDLYECSKLIRVTPKLRSGAKIGDSIYVVRCDIPGVVKKVKNMCEKHVHELSSPRDGVDVSYLAEHHKGYINDKNDKIIACYIAQEKIKAVYVRLTECVSKYPYPLALQTKKEAQSENGGFQIKQNCGMLMVKDTLTNTKLNCALNLNVPLKEFFELINGGDDSNNRSAKRARHKSSFAAMGRDNTQEDVWGSSKQRVKISNCLINQEIKRKRSASLSILSNVAAKKAKNELDDDDDDDDDDNMVADGYEEDAVSSSGGGSDDEEEKEEEEERQSLPPLYHHSITKESGDSGALRKVFKTVVPEVDEQYTDIVTVDSAKKKIKFNFSRFLSPIENCTSNILPFVSLKSDVCGVSGFQNGHCLIRQESRDQINTHLYGNGSIMSLFSLIDDHFLEKFLKHIGMQKLMPTTQNKLGLQKFLTNVFQSSYHKSHPLCLGLGYNLTSGGTCSVSTAKKLNDTNVFPSPCSRKVSDLDFLNPLNPDQLQQELEDTILTSKQLKGVEAIANSLQKTIPNKYLTLAIKVALTRMPTDMLNKLIVTQSPKYNKTRNADVAKVKTYTDLLRSGLPLFDNMTFRCQIIPRIFCALILEKLEYDFTTEDWINNVISNKEFNYKDMVRRFNNMYTSKKKYFTKLGTEFLTACSTYILYLTASAHHGNEMAETLNTGNQAIVVDRLFNLSEDEAISKLPLLMTNVSACSEILFNVCDSAKKGTIINQALEHPMVVVSEPQILTQVYSTHRGDSFELLSFKKEDFFKTVTSDISVGCYNKSTHGSVSSIHQFPLCEKVALDQAMDDKDMYHNKTACASYTVPYNSKLYTQMSLEMASSDHNTILKNKNVNKRYEMAVTTPFNATSNTVMAFKATNRKVGRLQECSVYIREVKPVDDDDDDDAKPQLPPGNNPQAQEDEVPMVLLTSCTTWASVFQSLLTQRSKYGVNLHATTRIITADANSLEPYSVPLLTSKTAVKHSYLWNRSKVRTNKPIESDTNIAAKERSVFVSLKLYIKLRKLINDRLALFQIREHINSVNSVIIHATKNNVKLMEKFSGNEEKVTAALCTAKTKLANDAATMSSSTSQNGGGGVSNMQVTKSKKRKHDKIFDEEPELALALAKVRKIHTKAAAAKKIKKQQQQQQQQIQLNDTLTDIISSTIGNGNVVVDEPLAVAADLTPPLTPPPKKQKIEKKNREKQTKKKDKKKKKLKLKLKNFFP